VLDTGSTHTLLPRAFALELGLTPQARREELQGSGSDFEASPAPADISVVDANYPAVACWTIEDFEVWVPAEGSSLAHPVVGWDILEHFRMSIDPRLRRFDLLLIGGRGA